MEADPSVGNTRQEDDLSPGPGETARPKSPTAREKIRGLMAYVGPSRLRDSAVRCCAILVGIELLCLLFLGAGAIFERTFMVAPGTLEFVVFQRCWECPLVPVRVGEPGSLSVHQFECRLGCDKNVGLKIPGRGSTPQDLVWGEDYAFPTIDARVDPPVLRAKTKDGFGLAVDTTFWWKFVPIYDVTFTAAITKRGDTDSEATQSTDRKVKFGPDLSPGLRAGETAYKTYVGALEAVMAETTLKELFSMKLGEVAKKIEGRLPTGAGALVITKVVVNALSAETKLNQISAETVMNESAAAAAASEIRSKVGAA